MAHKNDNYQTNFIIDDPLSRKHRSLTFVDNALHVLYTVVPVKGGTSERCYRTRRGRTDKQRYAIVF
jgi:hypothetical protein